MKWFWLLLAIPCSAQQTSSFFGIEVFNGSNIASVSIPWGAQRMLNTSCAWQTINPLSTDHANGTYVWAGCDATMASLPAGVDAYFVMNRTPAWASSTPAGSCGALPNGSCYAPSDIDGANTILPTFMTDLMAHYHNKLKAVSCWNEPNATATWSASETLAHMVKICTAVHNAVRADGTAQVWTPEPTQQGVISGTTDFNNLATWFNAYFNAGGTKDVDAVVYHGYYIYWIGGQGVFGAPPYLPDPEMGNLPFQYLQTALQGQGLGAKPIIDGETNWVNASLTAAQMSAWDAKNILLDLNKGLQRQYFYLWDQTACTGIQFGGLYQTTVPGICTQGTNRGIVEGWIVGATLASPFCSNAPDDTWTCFLTSGGKPSIITWNSGSQVSKTVTIPQNMTGCVDITNSAVTITSQTIPINGTPVRCQ